MRAGEERLAELEALLRRAGARAGGAADDALARLPRAGDARGARASPRALARPSAACSGRRCGAPRAASIRPRGRALALLAAVAPSLAAAAGDRALPPARLLGGDHCALHGGHAHLCLFHPAAAQGGAAATLLALAAGGLGFALLSGAVALARARRAIAGLAPATRAGLAADVRVVASDAPVSLTLGAWRPRVVISDGLLRRLDAPALAVVLAHERAHARRRDALRTLFAHALSWPHLPRVRRALLAELALATERACDEAAAEQSGDRLLVAETIVEVEKLVAGWPRAGRGALAAAFGGSDVPPRVESLLAEPAPLAGAGRAWLTAAVALATLLPLAEPLHHATEHLLRALLFLF